MRWSALRPGYRVPLAKPALPRPQAEAAVKPVEVVRTNDYTEGVVVDHDGNLYFSHEKIVTKVTPDGKTSTWAQTGAPNGHKVLADGTHLICDASRHALLHLAADGSELKPAATESDGEPLRGPNDLTLDALGGVYFTDPANSDAGNPSGSIHYLDKAGTCHTVAQPSCLPQRNRDPPRRQRAARGREPPQPDLEVPRDRARQGRRAQRADRPATKRAKARSTTSPTASLLTPMATCMSPTTECGRSRLSALKAS